MSSDWKLWQGCIVESENTRRPVIAAALCGLSPPPSGIGVGFQVPIGDALFVLSAMLVGNALDTRLGEVVSRLLGSANAELGAGSPGPARGRTGEEGLKNG